MLALVLLLVLLLRACLLPLSLSLAVDAVVVVSVVVVARAVVAIASDDQDVVSTASMGYVCACVIHRGCCFGAFTCRRQPKRHLCSTVLLCILNTVFYTPLPRGVSIRS